MCRESLSFVRADTAEGVKQLDKMALTCLKNRLSLIESSHTCTTKARRRKTRFSARRCTETPSPLCRLRRRSSLCTCGNRDHVGFCERCLFFPSFFLFLVFLLLSLLYFNFFSRDCHCGFTLPHLSLTEAKGQQQGLGLEIGLYIPVLVELSADCFNWRFHRRVLNVHKGSGMLTRRNESQRVN